VDGSVIGAGSADYNKAERFASAAFRIAPPEITAGILG
jgi:hypothetical protein